MDNTWLVPGGNCTCCPRGHLRDWSLITGRSGRELKNGRGGVCEVFPLPNKKGWGEKVLAMAKGGTQSFEAVLI